MVHACGVNNQKNDEENVLFDIKQWTLTSPQNLAARSFAWNGTCWPWEWTHIMETETTVLMLLTHHAKVRVLWSQSILPEDGDHRFLPRNPVSDTWEKSAVLLGSVILPGFIGFLCTGTTTVNKSTNTWSYRSNEFLRGKVFQFHKMMENSLIHWSSNLPLWYERIDKFIN